MRSLYIPYSSPVVSGEEQAARSLNSAIALFIIVSTAILFGLTVLYSTSYGVAGPMYFKKQLLWGGLGAAGGIAVFLFGYKRLVALSPLFMIISIILLAVALSFPAIKGAHRWIQVPGVGSIQPSEYAKLAIALYLARYCSDKMRNINSWSFKTGFIPLCASCGAVMGMILLGRDLGTTVLAGIVLVMILFVSGLKFRILSIPVLFLPPALLYGIKQVDAVRWARIKSFLNPEAYISEDGYQLWNSFLALGSGGWTGVGFMNSRLKHKYLPEAHTDFILSIVGEELGLAGMLFVVMLYISFAIAGALISMNANSRQGMILGFALTALISLQAFINIGVISGGLPTKGMPAPFISYGGSNLVVCMLATALLLSIAIETARPGFNNNIIVELKEYWKKLWNSQA
ncbi:MAG: FtsW/RodA/SpoVE family cell cycle protein [Victivallales bacterium]|nr:FtsW/RodA/SpoVE family cell cycle protein [Victivallales bacterium]